MRQILYDNILFDDATTYLNIGSGSYKLAQFLVKSGKNVMDLDIKKQHNFSHPRYTFKKSNILNPDFMMEAHTFDVVIASHVMEHIPDTGTFLSLCHYMTTKYFIVLVPPFKHNIVGGHIHVFNLGLLMYNLAVANFDVVNGKFKKQGYNIIGIVEPIKNPEHVPLVHDTGDIEMLVKHGRLPDFFEQNIDGDFSSYNWYNEHP